MQAQHSENAPISEAPAASSDHSHEDTASTLNASHAQDAASSCSYNKAYQVFRSWCRGREHAVLGAVVGLIVALCIFNLGLLKTLIIAVCVCVGIAFGQYIDGNPRMLSIVKKLFRDNRN